MTVSQIAAFHILMILQCWYSDEHYSKLDESLISQLSITYQNGITNGLCKKAMAVGLDAGFVAMESLNKFLENFIQQYSVNSNQHLVTNTALSEIQDNKLSDLDNQKNGPQFDVSTIQDSVIRKRKGAPRVKRIKSSLKTKNIQSNTKKEKATCFCSR
ncbi:1911_t:CDS:2, partial [Dentiscutata heterogama]